MYCHCRSLTFVRVTDIAIVVREIDTEVYDFRCSMYCTVNARWKLFEVLAVKQHTKNLTLKLLTLVEWFFYEQMVLTHDPCSHSSTDKLCWRCTVQTDYSQILFCVY